VKNEDEDPGMTGRRDGQSETAGQQPRDGALLLREETQHRVRNTLALVRSIFRRTVDSGDTLESVDMHFNGRLDVLARHQVPRSADWDAGMNLEDLIRDEFHAFRFGGVPGITIAGPEVVVTQEQGQVLAMAMHELITNALKFGALSIEGASVRVTWTVADRMLELCWAESGVPMVLSAPPRRGFGRGFIEEALPYQFRAESSFTLRPGGVFCRISLPIPSNGK
jgi:two-component sensor histidine kinase